MTSMDTEDITIVEMVSDHEIACDYSEDKFCNREKAEWIMFRTPCVCGIAGAVLACTHCKEARLTTELGVLCHNCQELYEPARLRYSRVERIDKP